MNKKKTTQEYINELRSKLYYAETRDATLYETNFIYIDIVKRELDYVERLEAAPDISPIKKPVQLGYIDKLYFPWVRTLTHSQVKQNVTPAWPVHWLQHN
ncbi:MAG: hypothetical protein QTN59_04035 [Candidatus Electrothrix communis]|nr:MAG: hypothetical protein QTN59_04035 [Candidatus Electrothrix communis]